MRLRVVAMVSSRITKTFFSYCGSRENYQSSQVRLLSSTRRSRTNKKRRPHSAVTCPDSLSGSSSNLSRYRDWLGHGVVSKIIQILTRTSAKSSFRRRNEGNTTLAASFIPSSVPIYSRRVNCNLRVRRCEFFSFSPGDSTTLEIV